VNNTDILSRIVSVVAIAQYCLFFYCRQRLPLFNELVLGNRSKYHHKSYIAKTFLCGLHLCRRDYWPDFN